MSKFAFIVDGEVAKLGAFPETVDGNELTGDLAKTVAILRSNPIIVEIVDQLVEEGFLWDGQDFTPPVE
jgi:hypothetical protein